LYHECSFCQGKGLTDKLKVGILSFDGVHFFIR